MRDHNEINKMMALVLRYCAMTNRERVQEDCVALRRQLKTDCGKLVPSTSAAHCGVSLKVNDLRRRTELDGRRYEGATDVMVR